ncbi:molybdopterin-guanine dinucleotide biosynthesis protein [Cellulosimicrobium funkei]|nr:molybdopterin-guanine dinucleotide biosynthesis protein [Cellulosimicrobium funkei]
MSETQPAAPQPATVPPAARWPAEVMTALELDGVHPDFARLERLARTAAEASGNDGDVVATAFIAGYAAGLAEGSGQADFDRAHHASLRRIERLLDQPTP